MVVVTLLTALLASILAAVWNAFCFPALDVAAARPSSPRRRTSPPPGCPATAAATSWCPTYCQPCTLNDFRYSGCAFVGDTQLQIRFAVPDSYLAMASRTSSCTRSRPRRSLTRYPDARRPTG